MRTRVVLGLAALVLAGAAAPSSAAPPHRHQGTIVFSQLGDDGGQLMAVDADGTNLRRLSDSPGIDPTWSPDGRQVAFSGSAAGSGRGGADIIVMNADGSAARRVTTRAGYKRGPAWSPDGRSIAFTAVISRVGSAGPVYACELRVIDLATGGDRVLLDLGAMAYSTAAHAFLYQDAQCVGYPAWSPDGNEIAFESSNLSIVGPAETSYSRLYSIRPDGSGLRVIGQALAGSVPVWAPDGKRLLFAGPVDAPTGAWSVRSVARDGTDVRTVSPPGFDVGFLTPSPDGRAVAFQARTQQDPVSRLYRMPLAGGEPVPLTASGLRSLFPDWGPR